MQNYIEMFIKHCEQNFNITNEKNLDYQSLPICIIESVYSLRAKYDSITKKVVDRYAKNYMDNDKYSSKDTISIFLRNIEKDGLPTFITKLGNNQKLNGISKCAICQKKAEYLQYLNIDTLEDFKNFKSQELLYIIINSVKGIGYAGTNYLFMLAGDETKCKPDVFIHKCLTEACGRDFKDEDCQIIFTEAVKKLIKKYPYLTVRKLDRIIWKSYHSSIS